MEDFWGLKDSSNQGGELDEFDLVLIYEAQVRFRIQVKVRVRDLAIFEKVERRCGGVRRLKNY